MQDEIYSIWLQQVMGEGSRIVPLIIDYFGSARTFYESDDVEKHLFGMLTQQEWAKLQSIPLDAAVEIWEACERLGYSVLTPDAGDYPDRLRLLDDYPAALYIQGELPKIDQEVCIAMVGTRRASRYGYQTALSLAQHLSAGGAVVVSGCAKGIDTASHNGALIGGGKTVAVLGCGINTRYNMQNEGLRKVIAVNGALVSEYPPGSPPLSYHFPIRNRLISALSLGVIVVEAGAKSGSLITANLALEQGKDIYSVPGALNDLLAKGTNRLIFDGAKPIENAYDVLEEYVARFPNKLNLANLRSGRRLGNGEAGSKRERRESAAPAPRKRTASSQATAKAAQKPSAQPSKAASAPKEGLPVGLSERAGKMLQSLGASPTSMEVLMEELSLSASEMMQCITELELYGLIHTLPGQRYTRR